MVQTLGIAVGNANCYVAACKDGGIEILLNDYSQRSTPAMVAFGDNGRLIGVDASSNQNMNIKNTIYDILKLVGKSYEEASNFDLPFKLEPGSNGEVIIAVTHLREEKRFTPVQILAMLLSKLKEVAGGTDCVLNCPQFYNEIQRAAVYKAAVIAGLNPLHIIPDMTAVALYYAYYRTSKTDKDSNVISFINFGQSCLQTMIAYICPKNDTIHVLASDYEPEVGGRNFDLLLANHFINSQNLQLAPRSKLRLINECEKLKKQLSANSNAIALNIDCLISEDRDFSGSIDRATFEQFAEPLFKKIADCLIRTQENARKQYGILIKKLNSEKPKKKPTKSKSPEKPASQPAQDNGTQDKSKESELDKQPMEGVEIAADQPEAPVENPASTQPMDTIQNGIEAEDTSRLNEYKVFAVEIVGGSSRVPAFKRIVKDVFGLEPSTTLNTDEAVARGCVLHCATLHPGVKVKRQVRIEEVDQINIDLKSLKIEKELRDVEASLCEYDRQWKCRMDARNSLEEYIFDCRSKNLFVDEVNNIEDWLYEEGDTCSKEDFIVRLQDLKAREQILRKAQQPEPELNQEQPIQEQSEQDAPPTET